MIGGLYETNVTRRLVSSSNAYLMDDITWCVTRAGKIPKWQNISNMFGVVLWTFFAIFFVLMSIVTYFYIRRLKKTGKNFAWAMMNTLSIMINNSSYLDDKHISLRLFLALALFYGVHVNLVYQSAMTDSLTNPIFEEQISDIKTAVAKKFTFKGHITLKTFLNKDDEVNIT